jgi:hypothetical protein
MFPDVHIVGKHKKIRLLEGTSKKNTESINAPFARRLYLGDVHALINDPSSARDIISLKTHVREGR